MIKITKKLINEILKLKYPCDEDYNVLYRYIYDNILKNDNLVYLALKKYNKRI